MDWIATFNVVKCVPSHAVVHIIIEYAELCQNRTHPCEFWRAAFWERVAKSDQNVDRRGCTRAQKLVLRQFWRSQSDSEPLFCSGLKNDKKVNSGAPPGASSFPGLSWGFLARDEGNVAHQSAKPGTLNRWVRKDLVEHYLCQFLPVWRLNFFQFVMWFKASLGVRFGKAVPWTNVLADVTAENPILEFAFYFCWDFLF